MNETQKITLKLLNILRGPNLKKNFLYAFIALASFCLILFFLAFLANKQLTIYHFLNSHRLNIYEVDRYIANGGDINDLNKKGENCLFKLSWSSFTNGEEFVQSEFEYLIARGARVNLLNLEGENVLTQYIFKTDFEMAYSKADDNHRKTVVSNLIILKNVGFNIKARNKKGASALDKIKNIPELNQIFL